MATKAFADLNCSRNIHVRPSPGATGKQRRDMVERERRATGRAAA